MIKPLAVAGAGLAALAVLFFRDPNQPGSYGICPFLALTGLYCPGCGTLRAVHALVHARVGQALGFNAVTVLIALPTLLGLWFLWARRCWVGRTRQRLAPKLLMYSFVTVILVFTLVRNTPWGAALAP